MFLSVLSLYISHYYFYPKYNKQDRRHLIILDKIIRILKWLKKSKYKNRIKIYHKSLKYINVKVKKMIKSLDWFK